VFKYGQERIPTEFSHRKLNSFRMRSRRNVEWAGSNPWSVMVRLLTVALHALCGRMPDQRLLDLVFKSLTPNKCLCGRNLSRATEMRLRFCPFIHCAVQIQRTLIYISSQRHVRPMARS
jgi:hypothetical protein